MTDKGEGFSHGTSMPESKEADLYLNDIAEVESPGGDFYNPASGGGGKLVSGGNRSGPLPEGTNPFYSGGKKAERGD